MASCISSTSEMKVDVACFKREFPIMFEFYSSWARLKKSEVENVKRHGHELLQLLQLLQLEQHADRDLLLCKITSLSGSPSTLQRRRSFGGRTPASW